MKISQVDGPGETSHGIVRGHTGRRAAGTITVSDRSTSVASSEIVVDAGRVREFGDGTTHVIVQGTGDAITNGDALDLAYGDVAVLDATTGEIITTTIAQDTRPVGIVQTPAFSGDEASAVFAGFVGQVNTTGTVLAGDYLETSTSARLAQSSGTSPRTGSFGQALSDGPNPSALIFGASYIAAGGPSTLTGNAGRLIKVNDTETATEVLPYAAESAIDLYVNAATGSDTTGDGTSGTPYGSIGRALEDIPTIVNRTYTVHVADGTYREQVNVDRFVFLSYLDTGDALIALTGNTTTPGNCIISGADAGAPTTPVRDFCIYTRRSRLTIQGFSLQYAAVRGLQADTFAFIVLGKMTYANCADGFLIGLYTKALLIGNQTVTNAANGIYLTEFARLTTDAGSRSVTMTGITSRGLYVVESMLLLNTGDSLSITAAGSGTRTSGIEADGNAVIDVPVSVTVSGAFANGIVAVAGGRVHVASASLSVSGYSGAAEYANDFGSVWDATASAFLAGSPTVGFATPAIVLGTAAAAGSASTVIRSDATIVAFDATSPTTQAVGDSAATGSAAVAARRDHKHAITRPALDDLSDVVITSAASGDRIRYDGSNFVNSALRWEPHVAYDGTVVLNGNGDPVMVEVA